MSTPDPSVPTRTIPATPPTPEAVTVAADGPPTVAAPVPDVPGYALERELGRGGMGVVWLARHLEHGRPVALKMILAGGHAGPVARERFRAEVGAVAKLSHPGIVQVYEVGETAGQPWCALEFCPGGTLAGRLKAGPLPPREAASVVRQLAQAVQHAHAHNITHRDLKPDNVLVAADGTLKVADFGLAKHADADAGMTASGAMMGTPAYMAPEQWTDARRAGPAADVWALGVILYECLAGSRPFTGDTQHGIMTRVLNDEPARATGVPADLDTIVRKCLEKEPSRRFASTEALAEELRRWLDGEPLTVRPVGRAERAAKWVRRNPALATMTAAVVLTLVAGAAVATAFGLHAAEQARLARAAEGKERERADGERRAKEAESAARRGLEDQKAETARELDRAERAAYAASLALARREWLDGNPARAIGLLESCRLDYRGPEHAYLWTAFHGDGIIFSGHDHAVASVCFSPEGGTLASASWDGTVRLRDAVTGRERLVFRGHAGLVRAVAFSPDGRRVASCGADKVVRVWDTDGRELLVLRGHGAEVVAVAFSPDGRRIASGGDDLRVWDAATGTAVLTVPGAARVQSVAFSPDSLRVATGLLRGVQVWDATTGLPSFPFRPGSIPATTIAFGPDGRSLYCFEGQGDGRLNEFRVRDATTGEVSLTFGRSVNSTYALAVSPDGLRLASTGDGGAVRVWEAATGRLLFSLIGHTRYGGCVAFSPDGRRLASGSYDRTVRLWDASAPPGPEVLEPGGDLLALIPTPAGPRVLARGRGAAGGLSVRDVASGRTIADIEGNLTHGSARFAEGGSLVALASPYDDTRVHDTSGGEPAVTLRGSKGPNRMAFHPSGRRLAAAFLDGSLKVWDVRTGEEAFCAQVHPRGFTDVAFSPDGGKLATCGSDRAVRLWGAADGKQGRVLHGHSRPVVSVTFSPDGRLIASADGEEDGTGDIRVWDAESGEPVFAVRGHTGFVSELAFAPDGSRLASCGPDRTVRLWETTTGRELLCLTSHRFGVRGVTFGASGDPLSWGASASTGESELFSWQARFGQHVFLLRGGTGPLTSAGITADGTVVRAADASGAAFAWDVRTGKPVPAGVHADTGPVSAEGRWEVSIDPSDSAAVRLTDRVEADRRRTAERAALTCRAAPDPTFHRRELAAAEAASDWFAAAFHAEQLAAGPPADAALGDKAVALWQKADQPARAALNAARLALPLTPGP